MLKLKTKLILTPKQVQVNTANSPEFYDAVEKINEVLNNYSGEDPIMLGFVPPISVRNALEKELNRSDWSLHLYAEGWGISKRRWHFDLSCLAAPIISMLFGSLPLVMPCDTEISKSWMAFFYGIAAVSFLVGLALANPRKV